MRNHAVRNTLVFAFLFALVVAWIVLLLYVPTDEIVAYIGVSNTYLVVCIFGVVAGFSSLGGGSFYAAIATFAAGGANPLLLGIAGGIGLFVSDSFFYYVARRGVEAFEENTKGASVWLARKIERLPRSAVLGAVYIYSAVIPIPSDIMLAALALARYPYKGFAPLLAAGDLTFALILAFAGYFGVTFVL